MQIANPNESCSKCGMRANEAVRHCQACGFDLGPPNVRASRTAKEVAALQVRYENELEIAKKSGYSAELDAFAKLVAERSSVVVSMTAEVALQLVANEGNLYANYEQLVGGGSRVPAKFENDSHRLAVVGSLFGSYGEKLRYGVLSLTKNGLPTYGEIFCRLKPITIDTRVSFLEWNSYRFASEKKPSATDQFPPGYRADWERRSVLAAVKLGTQLQCGQTEKDWEGMLVVSDGKNRTLDDFIEAHIYEGFNVFSIEAMTAAANILRGRRTLVRAVITKFEKMQARS